MEIFVRKNIKLQDNTENSDFYNVKNVTRVYKNVDKLILKKITNVVWDTLVHHTLNRIHIEF